MPTKDDYNSALPSRDTDALVKIAEAIDSAPDRAVRAAATEAFIDLVASTKHRMGVMFLIKEALGQIRLDLKYLAFDLHATRVERDEYKRRLGE